MPLVSVIILNWNGKRFLKDCLDSLASQSLRDFEAVLLDNGSQDDSVGYVRENFPWVRLVSVPENLGFAGGNNEALKACRGSYIVTLNNDTKVEPDFLAALTAAADADPRIGMVAAKMLNFFDKGRIDSVGIRIASSGMAQNVGVGETDLGQYDEPREVFGPCAGAALYRREMLDRIGFFDPAFFAYYEDVDLAWRARLAGWRCVTAPAAVVLHVHSATSGKMSPFTVFHVQRNKWFVLFKNWPGGLLLRRLPGIVTLDLAALVLAVVRGRALAALRARAEVLRNLPRLLAARRQVQEGRALSSAEVTGLFTKGEGALSVFLRKVRD